MKVLYLHPAGAFGGASKSLIELYLAANKLHGLEAVILTPKGTATHAFRDAGMEVIETIGLSQFDHTRYGFYRGLRWLILLREFCYFPLTVFKLLQIKKKCAGIDLIHVNEITLLPSGYLAKWILNLPLVFHIRSVQHPDQQSLRSRWLFKCLGQLSSVNICIDETVQASMPPQMKTMVIHNCIDIGHEQTQKTPPENQVPVIGMAGVLLRSKGIYEFLQAAKILIQERQRTVHFLIAGENARQTTGLKRWLLKKLGFHQDVYADAKRFIVTNNLQSHVRLTGFIQDIRSFYPQIDIACFPSHLNACGRPVFEAALFGIPSVVAIKDPLADAIIHGKTGLAIDYPDPIILADALDKLILEAEFRVQLGNQARHWAENLYSPAKNAELLLQEYARRINRLTA